jgi:tetratricopeptide (TPR) repeat protein/predicted Ser/Thr protein kinase
MTSSREEDERVMEILAAARLKPAAEREAYLRTACAGDEELRGEVVDALSWEERMGGFLQQPVAVIADGNPPPDSAVAVVQFPAGLKMGQYLIESKLGEGGMGTVWLALDTRLGRQNAIKFLSDDLADAEARRRFQREAQMASALNHPHIVTVYDIGEFEGRQYLVTEYVDGGTLKDWIKVRRRTPNEVVELLTGVADGLAAAHQAGILHRDIKPMNILVARNGYAKLADFGLAKLAENGTIDLAAKLPEGRTRPGLILGTISYMSPEQASGQPLDSRSDIFSFGVVLYEMLSGERPFGGQTDLEVLKTIIHGELPPLSEEVPEAYRNVVEKALEKSPAERYQSMREMVVDLRRGQRSSAPGVEEAITPVEGGVAASHSKVWADVKETKPQRWVAAIVVVLLTVALGASWVIWHRRAVSTERSVLGLKDTVVLADVTNSTGDPVYDDTLRQGLAIQLEQSPFLSLVSDQRVHETLSLMGQSADVSLTPEIAHEVCERTGSAAVLESSIRPIGNQYVLGLRAKNCRTGELLDEEQMQAARKEDILNALSQIAGKFRTRVGESLTTVEQHNTPLADATTPSLEALKAYSMAWRVVSTTGSAAGIPLYQRAIEIDPQFAMAYVMLGRMYADVGELALSAENTSKAWQLRNRASDWERYFIVVSYHVQVTGNLEKAQQTCDVWAQTYPRDTRPYGFLSGMIYPVQGRYDQAIEKSRKSIESDPDSAFGYNILALADIATGDLEGAERALQKADQRRLKIPDLFVDRYEIAFLKNDQDSMDRVASQTPRESGAEDWIGHLESTVLAYSGRLQQATRMSRRAVDLARHGDQPERAALFQSGEAIRDAFFEDKATAVRRAESALALSRGRDVQYGAAFALALSGNLPRARVLSDDLERRFPEDTAVKFIYLPELRALIALKKHEPAKAIELLQAAVPYEQGEPPSSFFGFYGMYYTAYLRGEAYLAEHQGLAAAAEFQKIVDHPGVVISDPVGALAHVQLGRAFVLSGEKVKAKTAYREFLKLWKDADPRTSLLERARIEYMNLN